MLDALARQTALEFTAESLSDAANAAIEAVGKPISDGRVSNSIDVRTVRFYQGLGIVPKPGYRGRTAVYCFDHLVRLIAARRLQAEGHTLAQVQSAMSTRSTEELVAALSAVSRESAAANAAVALAVGAAARAGDGAKANAPVSRKASGTPSGSSELRAVQLAPGVTIVIDPSAVADTQAMVDAVRAAVRSLSALPRHHSKGATS